MGKIKLSKICFSCKIEKNDIEFNKSKKSKDGLYHMCKICKRIYDKNDYDTKSIRKQQIRNSTLKNRLKIQEFIFEFLKDKICIDCGESDVVVLDFDHRENKEFQIGSAL